MAMGRQESEQQPEFWVPTAALPQSPSTYDLVRNAEVDEDGTLFVPLDTGRRLWGSRHGSLTSLRVGAGERGVDDVASEFRDRLRARLGPEAMGLATYAVRADSLRASEGATDFGEYFTYFSFFIVVSALLLASLFFRLGVEQRAREIGILRATGFPVAVIRGLFVREALVVSLLGGGVGMAGAAGYAWLVMYGLRTWWIGAVQTTALALHVAPLPLILGAAGGIAAAIGAIFLALRRAVGATPRSLLGGWASATPLEEAHPRVFTPLFLALVIIMWSIGGRLADAVASAASERAIRRTAVMGSPSMERLTLEY